MKESLFDKIKQINEGGDEFWDARELGKILDYKKWENFHKVIKSAMVACESSGYYICEHFPEVRKPLRGGNGNIQYVMSYNLFRISQTEQKIKNDNIKGENNANKTHYEIGKNIREVIKKNSGTIPEEFPTPNKSLKELSKSNRIRY